MNHKIQVTEINKQSAKLSHDKNRILPVNRISQQGSAATDAKIPESDRKYAFFLAFALNPLHYKSGRKQRLSYKAYNKPHVIFIHVHFRLPPAALPVSVTISPLIYRQFLPRAGLACRISDNHALWFCG